MKETTEKTFQSDIEKGVVVVDFWAPWCGPCKMVAPILEDLQSDIGGKATILKMNVDENPDTAVKYDIRSIPTLVVFKDGQVVDRTVGSAPKAHYLKILEKHF